MKERKREGDGVGERPGEREREGGEMERVCVRER